MVKDEITGETREEAPCVMLLAKGLVLCCVDRNETLVKRDNYWMNGGKNGEPGAEIIRTKAEIICRWR